MNEIQAAAIAKANASMQPALKLYDQRCWLWRLTCRLELRDLVRLNGILAKLSDDDLKAVASFAEGLAEWPSSDVTPSGGAQVHEEPGGSPLEKGREEEKAPAAARGR